MKLSQLRKPLYEAPIGDYETIGLWGDKDRNSSFRHPVDRRLITSPKAIHKVFKAFSKVDAILNLYFVNLPEAGGKNNYYTTEVGIVDASYLAKYLPKTWEVLHQKMQDDKFNDEAINVIYTNNSGGDRVMMTPWIMAHRLGHAVQASNRREGRGPSTDAGHYWQEAEQHVERTIKQIFQTMYGFDFNRPVRNRRFGDDYGYGSTRTRYFWSDKLVARFFEMIGTTKAARDGRLTKVAFGGGGRPYEYMYEMFAQYLITGDIKFNRLPRSFGLRGVETYHTREPEGKYDYLLEQLAAYLKDYFYSVVEGMKGQYLIM